MSVKLKTSSGSTIKKQLVLEIEFSVIAFLDMTNN